MGDDQRGDDGENKGDIEEDFDVVILFDDPNPVVTV
jgi:hypothetical protein